jgi:glycosyltransferase involved in cell wall biosynthesis
MKTIVCFTFSDFAKDGGGRVRIYGILNGLIESGHKVMLISNASLQEDKFHKDIEHISLGFSLSDKQKRFFQFALACFPMSINKILFHNYLKKFKKRIAKKYRGEIIFFEYLDNSFGYFLYQNNLITNYINDTHGIASLEFKFNGTKGYSKLFHLLKEKVSLRLDMKVITSLKSMIVVSEEMKLYFKEKYPFCSRKLFLIPDGVNRGLCQQKIDYDLLEILSQKYKSYNQKIIFFAGSFKDLGGVVELLEVFISLSRKRDDIALLLIGDGEHFERVKRISKNAQCSNRIYVLGRISYAHLKTYQQLADVIVCPDKYHPYSEMVPHIKYFDSLASGKIVINGNFKVLSSINQNESLSLSYPPSNWVALEETIVYALENQDMLLDKYENVLKRVCIDYSYENYLKEFDISEIYE